MRLGPTLPAFVARLTELRRSHPALHADHFLTGAASDATLLPDVAWLRADGRSMTDTDWHDPPAALLIALLYAEGDRVALVLHRGADTENVTLPEPRDGMGTQSPVTTLTGGTGTCRDFALLMMEAARSLGFAARFVSGYLYDADKIGSGKDTVVGAGATHAWAQIYLPGAGWVPFDPTNALVSDRNLIRVAVTRDPTQAIPLAGSFTGGPHDFLGMDVSVEITAGTIAAKSGGA